MTVTINGTTGIDKVQDAVVQNATLAAGVPSKEKLPAGTVLQVVNGSYGTQVSTTSSTYVTTGISASITPTSATSKILVIINPVLSIYQLSTANFGMGISIYRNAGAVFSDSNNYDSLYIGPYGNYINVDRKRLVLQYLDSPATTSSTTYTLYMAAYQGTAYSCNNGALSTITLMEIAA